MTGAERIPAAPGAVELRGIEKSFDGTPVVRGVSLGVEAGKFLALLGGSGCGKTTLLRMIAGLEQPDAGSILIGGTDVTQLPPYRRPVNMMFQSYAVFPHLDVAGNVEYGLKAAGIARAERDALVGWAVRLVRLEGLERRKPDQLSGGQRQRVALARCLVKKPAVLLLDEPMAALDRNLREDMQRELVRIQRDVGTTFILVTHDQDEAMSMADQIAVMEAGQLVQCGSPSEIYDRPVNRFVAKFVGRVNLLDGTVRETDAKSVTITCDGEIVVRASPISGLAAGARCTVAVRPERVRVAPIATGLANDLRGTVESTVYFGDFVRVEIRLVGGVSFEATIGGRDREACVSLVPGHPVHVGFDGDAVAVLPP